MKQEKLLRDIACLPPTARQEAMDFIAFLKLRYGGYPMEETGNDLRIEKAEPTGDPAYAPKTRPLPISEQSANMFSAMEDEAFVGMWKDRSDVADSTAWVKDLRQREWS